MIDHALLQDFITEAGEHLEELESSLLQLESDPGNGEILNDIFRSVHSIKGAAQFVGIENISSLTHRLETLLDLARNGQLSLHQEVVDILMASKDRLAKLTEDLAEGQSEQASVDDLIAAINLHIDPPETSDDMAAIRVLSEDGSSLANNAEAMSSVLDHLQTLRSAANYMGYDKLLDYYDEWILETTSALAKIESGDTPSIEFIHDRLRVLEDRFPQLAQTTDIAKEPKVTPEEPTRDDFDEVIDTIFSTETTGDPATMSDATGNGASDNGDYEEYTEDLDQELFDIFLNHLTDSIRALWQEGQRWPETSKHSESLERCASILDRLQSSANYMGYSHLRSIFAQWRDKVEASREMLASGETVSLDFWDDYLDRIVKKFPNANFSFHMDQPPAEMDFEMSLETQPEADPTTDVAVAEPELFDILSNAFDDTGLGNADPGNDSFQSVIQEMISGRADPTMDHFMPAGLPADSGKPSPAGTEVPAAPSSKTKTPIATMAQQDGEPVESPPKQDSTPDEQQLAGKEKQQTVGEERGGHKKFKQSVRVDADKIDHLMNQVGELVVSRAFFFQLFNDLRFLHQDMKEEFGLSQKQLKPLREFSFRLGEATVALGRVSNELQEGVMKVRMLPIAQLFSRYPRLVRDLVHNSNKKVRLKTRGEDTELDKMIIEAISDPLIHIIRNAVDHGFETAEERRRLNKPETGTLLLEAYHESNHIVIEVTDDGRGIDTRHIRTKALEGGFMSEEDLDRMTERELWRLIMMPGFSTAGQATQTSGRGVGMDVVKKNIEKLNGTIEIDSKLGVQTQIRIKTPLTLAIISALLVRVGDELFTIPLTAVEETIRVYGHDITTIEGIEVIHLREKTTPILRLSDLFDLRPEHMEDGKNFIVIVNTGNQHVGLVVDALIGQEEVVIKPLPDYLRQKSGFSGATIIGDGHISLILDVYELVHMTKARQSHRRGSQSVTLPGNLAMAQPGGETTAPTIH